MRLLPLFCVFLIGLVLFYLEEHSKEASYSFASIPNLFVGAVQVANVFPMEDEKDDLFALDDDLDALEYADDEDDFESNTLALDRATVKFQLNNYPFLPVGSYLDSGSSLLSNNGAFRLLNQRDGTLVLKYQTFFSEQILWTSRPNTVGNTWLQVLPSGSLAIVDPATENVVVQYDATVPFPGGPNLPRLDITDAANLVVMAGTTQLWELGTNRLVTSAGIGADSSFWSNYRMKENIRWHVQRQLTMNNEYISANMTYKMVANCPQTALCNLEVSDIKTGQVLFKINNAGPVDINYWMLSESNEIVTVDAKGQITSRNSGSEVNTGYCGMSLEFSATGTLCMIPLNKNCRTSCISSSTISQSSTTSTPSTTTVAPPTTTTTPSTTSTTSPTTPSATYTVSPTTSTTNAPSTTSSTSSSMPSTTSATSTQLSSSNTRLPPNEIMTLTSAMYSLNQLFKLSLICPIPGFFFSQCYLQLLYVPSTKEIFSLPSTPALFSKWYMDAYGQLVISSDTAFFGSTVTLSWKEAKGIDFNSTRQHMQGCSAFLELGDNGRLCVNSTSCAGYCFFNGLPVYSTSHLQLITHGSYSMRVGQYMNMNVSMVSQNGKYMLSAKPDGSIVLIDVNEQQIAWQVKNATSSVLLVLQSNGTLAAIEQISSKTVWQSDNTIASLVPSSLHVDVTDDGNLVIMSGSSVIWNLGMKGLQKPTISILETNVIYSRNSMFYSANLNYKLYVSCIDRGFPYVAQCVMNFEMVNPSRILWSIPTPALSSWMLTSFGSFAAVDHAGVISEVFFPVGFPPSSCSWFLELRNNGSLCVLPRDDKCVGYCIYGTYQNLPAAAIVTMNDIKSRDFVLASPNARYKLSTSIAYGDVSLKLTMQPFDKLLWQSPNVAYNSFLNWKIASDGAIVSLNSDNTVSGTLFSSKMVKDAWCGWYLELTDNGYFCIKSSNNLATNSSSSCPSSSCIYTPSFLAPGESTLPYGMILQSNAFMTSPNKMFSLRNKPEGVLELRYNYGYVRWSSRPMNTQIVLKPLPNGLQMLDYYTSKPLFDIINNSKSSLKTNITLQDDGNLVVMSQEGALIWSLGSIDAPEYTLDERVSIAKNGAFFSANRTHSLRVQCDVQNYYSRSCSLNLVFEQTNTVISSTNLFSSQPEKYFDAWAFKLSGQSLSVYLSYNQAEVFSFYLANLKCDNYMKLEFSESGALCTKQPNCERHCLYNGHAFIDTRTAQYPAKGASVLQVGEIFNFDSYMMSPNGMHKAVLQQSSFTETWMIRFIPTDTVIWKKDFFISQTDAWLQLQQNGTVQLLDRNYRRVQWTTTETCGGNAIPRLELFDNGNLAVIADNTTIWSSESGHSYINPNLVQFAVSGSDTMLEETYLDKKAKLVSANGAYEFIMQGDGNLVFYSVIPSPTPVFASKTSGFNMLKFDKHGKLSVIDQLSTNQQWFMPNWANQTLRPHPLRLKLQNNGNLEIYDGINMPVWSSNAYVNWLYVANLKKVASGQSVMDMSYNLVAGSYLQSPNGAFMLTMQLDGNLVLKNVVLDKSLWSSGTFGTNYMAQVLSDGSLRVVTSNEAGEDKTLWSSNNGQPGRNGKVRLIVTNDGMAKVVDENNICWWFTINLDSVAKVQSASSFMKEYSVLPVGGYLQSPNGFFKMYMQDDGQLVVYFSQKLGDVKTRSIWASNTKCTDCFAVLGADGRIAVVSSPTGAHISSFGSTRLNLSSPVQLNLRDDGRVVVVDTKNTTLWDTDNKVEFVNLDLFPKVQSPSTKMTEGQILDNEAYLLSPNGLHQLQIRHSRDFVLAFLQPGSPKAPIWSSGESRKSWESYPYYIVMFQEDGNIAVVDPNTNKVYWKSSILSTAKRPVQLVLQDDAEFVLKDASNMIVWRSNTSHAYLDRSSIPKVGSGSFRLQEGFYLDNGAYIQSQNGLHRLHMSSDGTLLLNFEQLDARNKLNKKRLWTSPCKPINDYTYNYVATLTSAGSIMIYDATTAKVACVVNNPSVTRLIRPLSVEMHNNGNIEVWQDFIGNSRVFWAANTHHNYIDKSTLRWASNSGWQEGTWIDSDMSIYVGGLAGGLSISPTEGFTVGRPRATMVKLQTTTSDCTFCVATLEAGGIRILDSSTGQTVFFYPLSITKTTDFYNNNPIYIKGEPNTYNVCMFNVKGISQWCFPLPGWAYQYDNTGNVGDPIVLRSLNVNTLSTHEDVEMSELLFGGNPSTLGIAGYIELRQEAEFDKDFDLELDDDLDDLQLF